MTFESFVPTPQCPFCGEDRCIHFIGWTNDGKTIENRDDSDLHEPLKETDRIVKTGVSARVYRDKQEVMS